MSSVCLCLSSLFLSLYCKWKNEGVLQPSIHLICLFRPENENQGGCNGFHVQCGVGVHGVCLLLNTTQCGGTQQQTHTPWTRTPQCTWTNDNTTKQNINTHTQTPTHNTKHIPPPHPCTNTRPTHTDTLHWHTHTNISPILVHIRFLCTTAHVSIITNIIIIITQPPRQSLASATTQATT